MVITEATMKLTSAAFAGVFDLESLESHLLFINLSLEREYNRRACAPDAPIILLLK